MGGFKQDYLKIDSLSHAADVQSLDSLSGKVLCIDPLTGLGPADNRARIWQYGLRNPFPATFDEEGRLFLADVGLSALSIAADRGSAVEGTGTSTTYTFTVTRSGGLDQPATAKWKAAGVLDSVTVPTDGSDFVGGALPAGIVTFAPGRGSKDHHAAGGRRRPARSQ